MNRPPCRPGEAAAAGRSARTFVVGVLPARFGSTRFPGKMLHALAGKPLIQHAWENASRAKGLDRVIVATDDMRIAEVAFDFGAEVAMTRAAHRSGTDRIAEVIGRLRGVTHVVNVQGDEPDLPPRLIDRLAADLTAHPERQMNTLARRFLPHESMDDPNAVKVVTARDGHALYFSRSVIPSAPGGSGVAPGLLHLGVYGYRVDVLRRIVRLRPGALERAERLEQLRALENGIAIHVLRTTHRSSGIDTPADAARFERERGASSRRRGD